MQQYYEQSVKKLPTTRDYWLAVLVWFGVVAASGLSVWVFGPLLHAYPVAMLAIVMFVMFGLVYKKRLRLEYEYIFVGDEVQVDKIGKGGRKNLAKMEFSRLIYFGRYSAALKRRHKPYKVFSSYTGLTKELWCGIYMANDKKIMVIFEPDETLLGLIRDGLPRDLKKTAFPDASQPAPDDAETPS